MGSTFLSLWTVIILRLFTLSQHLGNALSPDKVPILWPYADGTVRISSPNFQKVLYLRQDFQYIWWFKCVANCTSVQEHVWLRVARMENKGSIIIEDTPDAKDYGLDIRGILTIRNQTFQNNGTEYRVDIRRWNIESDHVMLLYFEDEPAVKKVASNKSDQIQACNCNNTNSSGIDGNGPGSKDIAGILVPVHDPCVKGTDWKNPFLIVVVLLCIFASALVMCIVLLCRQSRSCYDSMAIICDAEGTHFVRRRVFPMVFHYNPGDDDPMLEV